MKAFKWTCSFLFLVTGCASGQVSDDLPYALSEIQHHVEDTFPQGTLSVSPNQREYTSNYFGPEELDTSRLSHWKKTKGKYRAQAKVWILGDRRPYHLEVQVNVDEIRRGQGGHTDYSSEGRNDELEELMSTKIQDTLQQKNQKKNVIDDFRPF